MLRYICDISDINHHLPKNKNLKVKKKSKVKKKVKKVKKVNCPGVIVMGGNCHGGKCPGAIVKRAIGLGNCPGGNYAGGNCPRTLYIITNLKNSLDIH